MATKKKTTPKKVSGTQNKKHVSKFINPIRGERIIHAVVGCKGSGKTNETKNIIKKYHKSRPNEKILIMDFYNEYTEYPIININDVLKFNLSKKHKPSRVLIEHNNPLLGKIFSVFKQGLLVVEENDILSGGNSLTGLLSINRCHDVDVLLTYNSIKRIPREIFKNVSHFRLHRNIDSFDLKKYFKTNYSVALWLALDIQSNIEDYSSIYVNTNRESVIGSTDEQLFDASVNYHKKMLTDFAKKYKG